jgi:hypothetical protein
MEEVASEPAAALFPTWIQQDNQYLKKKTGMDISKSNTHGCNEHEE